MTEWQDEPDDATPLGPEDRNGLIPSHVTLRQELNELEQQNILAAVIWAAGRARDPVHEPFGRGLHKRMYGNVWRWAGRYRRTDKNIGVPYWEVPLRLREAFDSTRYWVDHASFSPDEIAVRFHHALVFIHPFPKRQRPLVSPDGGSPGAGSWATDFHLGTQQPARRRSNPGRLYRGVEGGGSS